MPWLNIIVAFGVIGIAVIWGVRGSGRGLFSAFLAAICTIAAGAIAFGLWETATGMLFGVSEPLAYTLGLFVPFFLSLAVLRIAVDFLFVRSSIVVGDAIDFIGGAVFGVVSAVITMGIFVIGAAHLPLGPAMLGFEPREENAPSPAAPNSLWIPVDKVTLAFYEYLSLSGNAFGTSTPLAIYRPDAAEGAHLARVVYSREGQEGRQYARSTIAPDDVEVSAWYTIESSNVADLTIDRVGGVKREINYPWGDPASNGDRIVGTVLTFQSGAVESSGQLVVGPAQVRLIVEKDGESRGVYPIAIIAPADTESVNLTRFAVSTEEFLGSQGANSQARWGFEFLVPPGYEPVTMYVKNARVELPTETPTEIESAEVRDEALADNEFFSQYLGVREIGVIDPDAADRDSGDAQSVEDNESVRATSNMPSGYRLLTRLLPGGSYRAADRGNELVALNQMQFRKSELGDRTADRKLAVSKLASSSTTGVVQVTLVTRGAESIFGKSVRTAQKVANVLLTDASGRTYQPVGYVYDDNGGLVQVRYTPDQPIRSLAQIPNLTLTQRDHTLVLFFWVTSGAEVTRFTVGNDVYELDEPVTAGG